MSSGQKSFLLSEFRRYIQALLTIAVTLKAYITIGAFIEESEIAIGLDTEPMNSIADKFRRLLNINLLVPCGNCSPGSFVLNNIRIAGPRNRVRWVISEIEVPNGD